MVENGYNDQSEDGNRPVLPGALAGLAGSAGHVIDGSRIE